MRGCRGCLLGVLMIPMLCCGLGFCGLAYAYFNAPEPPVAEEFVARADEALQFEAAFIRPGTSGQNFTVVFNERQASSWMQYEVEKRQDDIRVPLKNVQVGLENDVIRVYGELGSVAMPLDVSIKPETDGGKLSLTVIEAHLGSLKVPKAVLDMIAAHMDEWLGEAFERLGRYASSNISIQDGFFVMNGTLR
ncbi:MAG TPA: hypothetical protein VHP83_17805 [Aggregatilineaceae bacterium]|nr:hypothetical protein [Aggregatilineaceae bacterium]